MAGSGAADGKGRGRKRGNRRRRDRSNLNAPGRTDALDWRARHHPLGEAAPAVSRSEGTIADADGRVAYPMRAIDVVDALMRRGRIDGRAAEAARDFERNFEVAHLTGVAARDVSAPIDRSHRSGPPRAEPHRVLAARDRVWAALEALGGVGTPGASAVWDILGMGMTIKQHAERCQFGDGRSLNPMAATGILVQACYTLAAHFGK
ncbi:MAG: hypothetical protein QF578_14935 [Alphaproteobacteria bacterium]|nr:hypothetical protein [Alphaproteobacteria bacterium]MDP6566120.1 hypothetical protein [Alphaproteobacteria bacterium]MDP6813778.1 hypothetical protein [Alphaproteobacteria bacterium]